MDPFDDDNDDDLSVDLTPLIDVVFMLLIFFIMTTTFSKPVMEIILPKAEQADTPEEKSKEILVSITQHGSLFYKDKRIELEQLVAELRRDSTAILNVYVDKAAPFEAFVEVVNMAKVEREGRFVISTEK